MWYRATRSSFFSYWIHLRGLPLHFHGAQKRQEGNSREKMKRKTSGKFCMKFYKARVQLESEFVPSARTSFNLLNLEIPLNVIKKHF